VALEHGEQVKLITSRRCISTHILHPGLAKAKVAGSNPVFR